MPSYNSLVVITIVISIAVCVAAGIVFCIFGRGFPPEHIEYDDYPYGENGTVIRLPIITCYPWYDLSARSAWASDQYNWFRGNNGTYCHKEWH